MWLGRGEWRGEGRQPTTPGFAVADVAAPDENVVVVQGAYKVCIGECRAGGGVSGQLQSSGSHGAHRLNSATSSCSSLTRITHKTFISRCAPRSASSYLVSIKSGRIFWLGGTVRSFKLTVACREVKFAFALDEEPSTNALVEPRTLSRAILIAPVSSSSSRTHRSGRP